jgi:FkbM family methyltransferase
MLAERVGRRMYQRVRDVVRPAWPSASQRWLRGSFSQSGEDLIVSTLFDVMGAELPTYLDIGAFHPYQLSNTALFYTQGSRGITVEPNPDSAGLFRTMRPRDRHLNVGVAAKPGHLTLYRMTAPTLNTFSLEAAEQACAASEGRQRIESTVDVDVVTVPQLLAGQRCPDFVSLDVEGLDVEILRTLPTWPGVPTVICVESVVFGSSDKIPEVREIAEANGYVSFADTGINTIFALRERVDAIRV